MIVTRFAVSFEPGLARAVRKAAGDQATSTWLADAARRKLRAEGLLRVVAEWEAEQGVITKSELEAVLPRRRRRQSDSCAAARVRPTSVTRTSR
jgi:hypothetical protein